MRFLVLSDLPVPVNPHFSAAVSYTHLDVYKRQDGAGMHPGERHEGWLCFTTDIGEYKLPFLIQTCLLYTSRQMGMGFM